MNRVYRIQGYIRIHLGLGLGFGLGPVADLIQTLQLLCFVIITVASHISQQEKPTKVNERKSGSGWLRLFFEFMMQTSYFFYYNLLTILFPLGVRVKNNVN